MKYPKKVLDKKDFDIFLIERAMRRDRNLRIVVGVCLIALGFGIISVFLQETPHKTYIALSIICLLVVFTGIYFTLSAALRYDIQKNELLKIIIKHPQKVVWVYHQQIQNMPYGINLITLNTLYICLNNHEKIAILMPAAQIPQLLELLRHRLTNATFGYAKSYEQMYEIAPDLLAKE